ncbi:hypothetical protein JTE90_024069 [Oedothorax gibbosus]|uniref:Uncharacterized protein n=1 Tax=Oedothorax gibbosus TaxID=931172 RepID=A0AAV6U0S8_9ARAC|nr:hypothetical protein JTE90_024069 [Oedothorax gibbosus]
MYHLVWIEASKRKNRNRLRKTLNSHQRFEQMNTTELQTLFLLGKIDLCEPGLRRNCLRLLETARNRL